MTTTSNLENDSSGKCFSGVLRRLFCAGSLQTYPSDNYLSELDKIDFNQPLKTQAQTSTTPGVVARLMGLDSMPDTNWRPTPDSIMRRSRSVSSVDFLPPFDLTRHSLHTRVKTWVSFPQVPTYLNQKNHHHLFLVCIDKVDAVTHKGELGTREVKEKKVECRKNERNLVKKRENQEIFKKSCGREENSKRVENVKDFDYYRQPNVNKKGKSPLKSMIDHKEERYQLKNMKLRKKAAGAQYKRVNSVASTSGTKELIITRKKSPAKVELYKNTSPSFVHHQIHKKVDKPLIKGLENNYYSKISKCILSLTEENTKESDWSFVSRKLFKFEDYEEICIKFGDEIFQLLLEKIMNELIFEN